MGEFKALGVSAKFEKGINELGIVTPSPIQEQVIPLLISEVTDLVAQAQTGTGKTAAFGLPLLEQINHKLDVVQGLILCPTRELGQQVAKQLFKFTKYSDKIFTECVYGGEKIDKQIANLRRKTHIVVATPGRLIDLLERKAVDLSQVRTIILDEADEMLSMGFKPQLDKILKSVTSAEQTWLFSATIPDGIKQIINKHLSKQAKRIQIDKKKVVNKKIKHQFVICDEQDKLHVAVNFLKTMGEERGIIFCKTKKAAITLVKQLSAKNIKVDGLHGDLKQVERDKVMRAFKNKNLNFLIATDIAARGIDVANLAFVLHYQLPDKMEYYTHRSGRTARGGNEGLSLAICTTADVKHIRFFEKKLNISFSQLR